MSETTKKTNLERTAATQIRRICGLFGVRAGSGRRRESPQIWADDPTLFDRVGDHAAAYLGAGFERVPLRMRLRADVAKRVRLDGSLPGGATTK